MNRNADTTGAFRGAATFALGLLAGAVMVISLGGTPAPQAAAAASSGTEPSCDERIALSVGHLQEDIELHEEWRDYVTAHPEFDVTYVGDADHHETWIGRFETMAAQVRALCGREPVSCENLGPSLGYLRESIDGHAWWRDYIEDNPSDPGYVIERPSDAPVMHDRDAGWHRLWIGRYETIVELLAESCPRLARAVGAVWNLAGFVWTAA